MKRIASGISNGGEASPSLQPCPPVTLEPKAIGSRASLPLPPLTGPQTPARNAPVYFRSDSHFSILRFTGKTLLGILFSSQMISAMVRFLIL